MKDHPDDAAFLDQQCWRSDGRACEVCPRTDRPVALLGYAEQNSGPGIPVLLCRPHFASRLFFARRGAEDARRPHIPGPSAI
jgi:hypothetical protein